MHTIGLLIHALAGSAAHTGRNDLVVSQITIGAIASWVLQRLKQASWFPILTEESSRVVKVLAAAITSICTVTGISYVYDPNAHTLLLSGFSLTLIAQAAWHFLQQFVMQEGWYQAVFNRPNPTPPSKA